MAGRKRVVEDGGAAQKTKKRKISKGGEDKKSHVASSSQAVSTLVSEDIDFPRGGGTTLTPLEVKNIRTEGAKEADQELFKDAQKKTKRAKRKSDGGDMAAVIGDKSDKTRVEHLNYKRITIGMKLLGQVVAVQPLALIISLPDQLFGHVPITQVSEQLTHALENVNKDEDESDNDDDEDSDDSSHAPDLFQLFRPGRYVRTVVTAVHAPGLTDAIGLSRSRDEVAKASRRVELSLVPERVNAGLRAADLKPGFTLSSAIKSAEDHGYILDLGVTDVSGFLSFADVKKHLPEVERTLHVGQILDVHVTKLSENGRTCAVCVDSSLLASASLTEVTNVTSVLPGTLVQGLITNVLPDGLVLQILGFFEGTIDQYHLPLERGFKIGQRIRSRVLYDIASSPPKFVLSLSEHVSRLQVKRFKTGDKSQEMPSILDAFPVGMLLESVKVIRAESERGLVVEVQPGVQGFVHISHVSDDHIPSLPSGSGSWKVGTTHRARVIGYFHLDGLLQLSFKQSVLEQKFMQAGDLHVGELIKGTVKKLTDSALFVSISGNVDGVVWPNHFADITLKHPAKRFKPGGTVKCRVLVVDPERKRVSLTAKKTLVESTLPILSRFEDVKVGVITNAVVFKATDKTLFIEFFNNLKGFVPLREALEGNSVALSDAYQVGKVVKICIISVDQDSRRILASIRRVSSAFKPTVTDISGIEIGNSAEGVVSEIHKENAVLSLEPSSARALLSLNNLANHRGLSLAQLKVSLKVGQKLDNLVVVARNPEKGFVIVANRPTSKASLSLKTPLTMDTVETGQIVGGRVTRHARHGTHIKLTARINGFLHPTDVSDNYEAGAPFPNIDTILKAAVISIDQDKRLLTLSTRHSRLYPDQNKSVVDREINTINDIKVGDTVRGFIKSVVEHGLFVTIGRGLDARVQIKELFDEFVKDWKGRFEAGKLVKGRILSIDKENNKMELTLRSGDLKRNSSGGLTLSDLHEGDKIEGRVKKIEDYGIFIQIEGSKVSGLCHKSELSDNTDANVSLALKTFREGDRVKAVILSVDTEKRQISFGLKPSYFTEEDAQSAVSGEADVPSKDLQRSKTIEDRGEAGDEDMSDVDDEQEASESGPEDDDDDDDDIMDIDTSALFKTPDKPNTQRSPSPIHVPLKLEGGFQWSGLNQNTGGDEEPEESSSEGSDNEEETLKKKKRKRKEIEQDLTADMHTKTPESNADFERLLLGSPNSSFLWIQYMSFQLQLSEVEKAREIAKRALRTINFREEQEKLNVWIALLNLENSFGTDESLEATFKDAARHNDSKTIHLRLASILDQTSKHEKAEEQYKRTCKKFGYSSKVWTLFGEHYLRRGDLESSRKLLPRSLQSLEKRKHLKTISKFAQLEYSLGDPERGKTIFEGIVDSHPKRWDFWSVYVDMEAGQKNIQSIRNIFDRVLAHKMTSHKAKSFFKKWLGLEHEIGDQEGAENVKQKAIEWTQRAAQS